MSWYEQDGYEENAARRIMAVQVTEEGGSLTQPETLAEGGLGWDHFHVRFDEAILTGFSESGPDADTMQFVRWRCTGD